MRCLRVVAVANEITTAKMENDNNVNTIKVEEPVQVMMKDPKKVVEGKRLAEYNHMKKEELAQADKA